MYLVHITLSYPVHFVTFVTPYSDPCRPHVHLKHISRSPHHTLAPHYSPLHRFIHPSDRERVFTLTHPSPLPYALKRRLKFASSTWQFSLIFTLSQPQLGNTTLTSRLLRSPPASLPLTQSILAPCILLSRPAFLLPSPRQLLTHPAPFSQSPSRTLAPSPRYLSMQTYEPKGRLCVLHPPTVFHALHTPTF